MSLYERRIYGTAVKNISTEYENVSNHGMPGIVVKVTWKLAKKIKGSFSQL